MRDQEDKKKALVASARRLMKGRIMMPEEKSGDLRIEHRVIPAGKKMPVVNFREAIFSGLPPCDLTLNQDYIQHWLVSEEDGSWMSDQPAELVQMEQELARHARGNVLIGGLGLGIVANMVSRRKSVKRIVVVEQSRDVTNLVAQYLPPKVEIVHSDIHHYLNTLDALSISLKFDAALIDTWQSTGEWSWQSEVVPMRRKIGSRIKKVVCWQERVMHGQVWNMLFRAADTDEALFRRRGTCHYYAFRCAMRDLGIRPIARITANDRGLDAITNDIAIGEENLKDDRLVAFARHFLLDVGCKSWEDNFGKHWDEAWAVHRERDVA